MAVSAVREVGRSTYLEVGLLLAVIRSARTATRGHVPEVRPSPDGYGLTTNPRKKTTKPAHVLINGRRDDVPNLPVKGTRVTFLR